MFEKVKRFAKKIATSRKTQMTCLMMVCGVTALMAQTTAGDYSAGTAALTQVSEEINFGVNPTKYNTCIKSYLSNNNTSYTMNYSIKVNFNNT